MPLSPAAATLKPPSSARARLLPKIPRMAAIPWDLLVAMLLLAIVIRSYWTQAVPVWVPYIEAGDDSIKLDLIAKARAGIWLGKQTMFNYGPLFQWIVTHMPLRGGMTLGSYYASISLFLYGSTIPLVYAAQSILLRRQARWLRACFVFLVVVFWLPIHPALVDAKVLLPLLSFAVFSWMAEKLSASQSAIAWRGALAASMVAIGYLFSPEAGTYSLAALGIVFGVNVVMGERRKALLLGGLTGLFGLLWVLAINAFFFRLPDFTFWRRYSETTQHYRWSQALAMLPPLEHAGAGIVAVCAALFLAAWLFHSRGDARSGATLVAMALLGLIMLQSGIVVGEGSHLALALFPLMFLAGAALLGAGAANPNNPRASAFGLLLIVGLTAAATGPHEMFRARAVFAKSATQGSGCPEGLRLLDGACVTKNDFDNYQPVAAALASVSAANDSVLVFPNDTIYAFLARRRVAGLVPQNYVVAGDYMTQAQLASFEADKPAAAVYSADQLATLQRGGVSNFVRTPLIWFYLQEHYGRGSTPRLGIKVLRRDEGRAIRRNESKLPVQSESLELVANGSRENAWAEIAKFAPPQSSLDFFRVRMRVGYPPWWRVLKPPQIVLHVQYAGGGERRVPVIVQPDRDYDVWIYPWDEAQLLNYFSSQPEVWRTGVRPTIERLWLEFRAMDEFSVMPSRLELRELRAVILEMRPPA